MKQFDVSVDIALRPSQDRRLDAVMPSSQEDNVYFSSWTKLDRCRSPGACGCPDYFRCMRNENFRTR